MEKIIFLGNGMLANYALAVLEQHFEVIFRATTREDLTEVVRLKNAHPEAHGVLTSFGVMIRPEILELFEPEGILNIHPSLLPKYRGASPIESAILAGERTFSVSIMKLVKAMDAGPIYHQITVLPKGVTVLAEPTWYHNFVRDNSIELSDADLKFHLYKVLAKMGADWLAQNLDGLPKPNAQNDARATFTQKFDKTRSLLDPETKSAVELLREVQAFQGFPKSKYHFYGKECIILVAHVAEAPTELAVKCADQNYLCIDRLQPAGKKPMEVAAFLNGYRRK